MFFGILLFLTPVNFYFNNSNDEQQIRCHLVSMIWYKFVCNFFSYTLIFFLLAFVLR